MMEDLMKDKKKLAIILIIVGILVLGVVVFLLLKNNANDNINNNQPNNNQEEKPVAVSTFDISDFEVSESASGKVKMAFKLTNTADTPIETEVLDINMYDGTNLVYTYNYLIESLEIDESIYIEATSELDYIRLSRFEFVIDSSKVDITPNYLED